MNQPLSPAFDRPEPAPGTPLDEDVAAAVRLPGPLGRRRAGLPVASAAPPVPTALSTFNRLTGRLDAAPSEGAAVVVAELGGAPVAPLRPAVHDRA